MVREREEKEDGRGGEGRLTDSGLKRWTRTRSSSGARDLMFLNVADCEGRQGILITASCGTYHAEDWLIGLPTRRQPKNPNPRI